VWPRNWNKGRCLLLGDASQPRKSLSRFLTTEHTEHTEINPPAVMLSFRVFGVFRGSLIFADKSEYVVAAPQWNHFLSLPRIDVPVHDRIPTRIGRQDLLISSQTKRCLAKDPFAYLR